MADTNTFSRLSPEEKCNKKPGYRWNPILKTCERISKIKEPVKEEKKSGVKDAVKGALVNAASNKLVGRPTTAPIPEPLPKAQYGGTLSPEDRLLQIKANREASAGQSQVPETRFTTSEDAVIRNAEGVIVPTEAVNPSFFDKKVKGQLEAESLLAQEGRLTTEQQIALEQRQQELQNTLNGNMQGGQSNGVMSGQVSSIDMRQARLSVFSDPANVLTLVGGGYAGFKAGGLAGGATGIPHLAAIGAVGGFAIGVYSSIQKNVKAQRTDNLAAQKQVLTDTKTYGNQLVALMNTDPDNAQIYLNQWLELQNNNKKAYSQLQIDTQSAKNLKFGLDGTRELQKFENFYSPGGGYDYQRAKLEMAIAAPNFEEGMANLMLSSQSIGVDDE